MIGECNVFVLPSTHPEGFPLAFLETAERGLATLVTTSSAIPELFETPREYLPLDLDDPDSLLSAMRAIAADPEARAAMGRAGRAAVHRLCTIDKAGAQYLACYEELAL